MTRFVRTHRHQFGLRGVFLLMVMCGLIFALYRPHVIKSRSEKNVLLQIADLTQDAEMKFSQPEGLPWARYVGTIYFTKASINAGNIIELKGLLTQLPHLVCVDLGQSSVSMDLLEELKASTTAFVGRNASGLRRYRVLDLKHKNSMD